MYRWWLRRVLLGGVVCLLAWVAVGGPSESPAARPIQQPGPLVLVGMPSLQFGDVTSTAMPHLWRLATQGAVGAQATMVIDGRSCSVSSWLTLSAGTPTGSDRSPVIAGEPGERGCEHALPPKPGRHHGAYYPNWSELIQQSRTRGAPVEVGVLASALAGVGQCIAAGGDAAAIGAADMGGYVASATSNVDDVGLRRCPVTFLALDGPDDAFLGRLLTRLPADATVVVSGMADDAGPVTFHPVVVSGPGTRHGLLRSSSTRQPGVLQTSDLTALVLSRLGENAPHLSDGRVPTVLPSSDPVQPLQRARGLTRALDVEHGFVVPFFALFLGGCLLAVGMIVLGWWLVQGRRAWAAFRAVVAVAAAMVAATPVSTFLVGRMAWWETGAPQVALALSVLGTAVVLAAGALLGPWRRHPLGPTIALAALTVGVIGADVVHGSRLQFMSLLGLQPVYGGRYYGQGNVGFALYATAALLLATLLAVPLVAAGRRRAATAVVAVLGIVVVVVDGFPSWGADGGGPLAMVPAFAYLALRAAGARLTFRRGALIAAAAIVVVLAFAVTDYLRPPAERTHIGIFVDQFLTTHRVDGLQRIWSENATMLTSSWIDLAVVPLVLVVVLFLLRPGAVGRALSRASARMPLLADGLVAIAACWLIGFAVNDSGTAIPPTGLLLLAPLVLLLAVGPLRDRPIGSGTPAGADPDPTPGTGPRAPLSDRPLVA